MLEKTRERYWALPESCRALAWASNKSCVRRSAASKTFPSSPVSMGDRAIALHVSMLGDRAIALHMSMGDRAIALHMRVF